METCQNVSEAYRTEVDSYKGKWKKLHEEPEAKIGLKKRRTGGDKRLSHLRRVPGDAKTRPPEMRTTLETELARLNWRNAEDRFMEKVQAASYGGIQAVCESLDAKIGHLEGQVKEIQILRELRTDYERSHEPEAGVITLEERQKSFGKSLLDRIQGILTKSEAEFVLAQDTLQDAISRVEGMNGYTLVKRDNLPGEYELQAIDVKTTSGQGPNRKLTESRAEIAKLWSTIKVERSQFNRADTDFKMRLRRLSQEVENLRVRLHQVQETLIWERSHQHECLEELKRERQSHKETPRELQPGLQQDMPAYEEIHKAIKRNFRRTSGKLDDAIMENAKLGEALERKQKEVDDLNERLGRLTAKSVTADENLVMMKIQIDETTQKLQIARALETRQQEALEQQKELIEHFQTKLQNIENMFDKRIQEMIDKLHMEERRRLLLFEQVQQLRGAVRVICRIRPDSSRELLEYRTEKGEYHNHPANLIVRDPKDVARRETWTFERIFPPQETNGNVFSEIGNFIQSFLDGKKVCIFCYGQSGAGKTYTMSNLGKMEHRKEGTHHEDDGIIHRVKTMIFDEKKRLDDIGHDMKIMGCCYEIYGRGLWLLKAGGNVKKRVGRAITNPESQILSSTSDFDTLIEFGMKNRKFVKTQLNDNSSRSHFIISLMTTIKSKGSPEVERNGLLNLIDLAGSEKTTQAGTTGSSFQEGNDINVSLSALGRVFSNLAKGENPSFKENVLTEFLEPSLGKDCMTLMFVMISPLKDNWPTTRYALNFASGVKAVKKVDPISRGTRVANERAPSSRAPNPTPGRGTRR